MKLYKGDLHIHTCLSPCGELEMSPLRVVKEGLARGLDIIAICDHNSAENVGAAIRAGAELGIHVLPGLEINSLEEIHALAIFDREEQAMRMQAIVYAGLQGTNRPDIFGEQVVVNEFDEVERFEDRMLIASTQLGIDEIAGEVHRLGGIVIASHVDRPSYSIISQLGFMPSGLELDAVEISCNSKIESFLKDNNALKGLPVITSSDAHLPGDVGSRCTSFFIEFPCVNELRMAFQNRSERRIVY